MILEHTLWEPCFRIIPSRFPPIDLFETVSDPADWDFVFALESMTNPRLRDAVGNIGNVPVADRVSGPGASYVMAPFTHINPNGSRFSDGNFGIYYTADTLDTAIAETIHHHVNHLRETCEPPQMLDMRVLHARVEGEFLDIRGPGHDAYHHPADYAASRELGRATKQAGRDGIRYWSVRRPPGECLAVFRPCLVSGCIQTCHLGYPWNGETIPREAIVTLSAPCEPDSRASRES